MGESEWRGDNMVQRDERLELRRTANNPISSR